MENLLDDEIKKKIRKVSENKAKWSNLGYAEKLDFLERIYAKFSKLHHETWARESLETQGYSIVIPEVFLAVEMITNTSLIGSDLQTLIEVYKSLRDTNEPPSVKTRSSAESEDNGVIADVFPRSSADGWRPDSDWKVEVWMKGEHAGKQGSPPKHPRACLLLGAGNHTLLSVCDALHVLFVENMTCIVKHNPVREYNHDWFEMLFEPLITAGYFASTTGDIETSKALLAYDGIDHVHMTGGKATHDMIVWGSQTKREKNVLNKPITSELGNVTPYIFSPGTWSDEEITHHAQYFATVLMSNNGCNCMAPQVLILPSEGFPVDQFLGLVKETMESRPHTAPFYPGTRERYKAWVDHFGKDSDFVESKIKLPPGKYGSPLPWALSKVNFDDLMLGKHHIATGVEAFGPTLAICCIESISATEQASYWEKVIDLCNNKLYGSLSATVISHPTMENDLVTKIIRELKYGSVGINSWGGQSFGYNCGTWGAYPGETLEAVESGIGHVRNYLFFQGTQKTVVYALFVQKVTTELGAQHHQICTTPIFCVRIFSLMHHLEGSLNPSVSMPCPYVWDTVLLLSKKSSL